jgi:hypothetical protein
MRPFLRNFLDFFSDTEDPREPRYDPVHIAALIVLTLFGIRDLFWALWALLVFGGGIQHKIVPAFLVLLTSRTPKDFGYAGYPYEMGVFEGWITNVAALAFLLLIIAGIWYALRERKRPGQTI